MKSRLEILNARLLEYHKAERAILSGQSYKMGDVELTRANLETVIKMIAQLEAEILKLSSKFRTRIRTFIPLDGNSYYKRFKR